MMTQTLNYIRLMNNAKRGVIRNILETVAQDGLPGAHHFYIGFDTKNSGTQIPDWLFDRYPEEMTIVVQEWFDNLEIDDEGFAITLNFGNQPEPLYIPFSAIKTFVDPAVEFGLSFETSEDDAPEPEDDSPDPDDRAPIPDEGGEVVRLDLFRK